VGDELGASLYLREIHGLKKGRPPGLNIDREMKMHDAVRAAIRTGDVRSAHDLAEGGLLVALAECAMGGATRLGATVKLEGSGARLDALLHGESQSRAILTAPSEKADAVVALFQRHGVPVQRIGAVGGNQLTVHVHAAAKSHTKLTWEVSALHDAWNGALDSYLE
jgi:phosphoribosylformylglycinamidine synthase